MKAADLKKGVEYAMEVGYSHDVRREEDWVRVEYVGPSVKNPGAVDVRLLADGRVETWSVYGRIEARKAGEIVSVHSRKIALPWAELIERAGEARSAAEERETLLGEIAALVHELDASVPVRRSDNYSRDEQQTIRVDFYQGRDTFDAETFFVRMPAEIFRKLRKLLMGVAT